MLKVLVYSYSYGWRSSRKIERALHHNMSFIWLAGGLKPAYYHNTSNTINPVITVSASGANAGYVNIYLEDIWVSDCSYVDSSLTDSVFFVHNLLLHQ